MHSVFFAEKHLMRSWIIVLIVSLAIPKITAAQEVEMAELRSMVALEHFSVDTIMKKKGYRLMQKDKDSVSEQYYYSHLERNDQGPSWVRALSYIDVNLDQVSSRILTYRTYNRIEYQKLMAAMLSLGYRTKDTFDFRDSKHTVFEDGQLPIRVKVTNNRMANGKWVKSYEFELGK